LHCLTFLLHAPTFSINPTMSSPVIMRLCHHTLILFSIINPFILRYVSLEPSQYVLLSGSICNSNTYLMQL
jgi:hypothetical protein